jgi:hypothetical protein
MEETAVSVDGPKVTKKRKDFWVEDAEGSVVVNPCSTKWIQFRAARNQYDTIIKTMRGSFDEASRILPSIAEVKRVGNLPPTKTVPK